MAGSTPMATVVVNPHSEPQAGFVLPPSPPKTPQPHRLGCEGFLSPQLLILPQSRTQELLTNSHRPGRT